MTFKRFEEIFKSRYPDGTVFMHDDFMKGSRGNREKVAVIFSPGGKTYMYRGAYEDILCRVGINAISKERLAEAEIRLETLKRRHGDVNMFGSAFGYIDEWHDILKTEAFLAEVRNGLWIVG